MKIDAVTTFNDKGLAQYGINMLRSFYERWAFETTLHVYTEGWYPYQLSEHGVDPDWPQFRFYDLNIASKWLVPFKLRHAGLSTMPGFRHDVVRFSHKVAALCEAARNSDADYLIWLDADVFLHQDFCIENLQPFLPQGNEWIAWLDRTRAYPECGFYILNLKHPLHELNLAAFENMYTQDLFLQEKEYHDSYLLMRVVQTRNIVAKSLSGKGKMSHHPLVNGPLGKYFDHLKGRRKEVGRSLASDLVFRRDEPYWRKK